MMTTTITNEAFAAGLANVVDSMLERACPCRFLRFRATVARDTREIGAPGYTCFEQQMLVRLFDQKVPRVALKRIDEWRETGRCGVCAAAFERRGEEVFRDAWIEYAVITPELPDIGAPLHTPPPHCFPFFAAGPEQRRDLRHLVELHYPAIGPEQWLDWLAA